MTRTTVIVSVIGSLGSAYVAYMLALCAANEIGRGWALAAYCGAVALLFAYISFDSARMAVKRIKERRYVTAGELMRRGRA